MSAYVVDRDHIRYLVSAATQMRRGIDSGELRWRNGKGPVRILPHGDAERAADVGQVLWDENVASVEYRYPKSGGDLPGPVLPEGHGYVYGPHRAWAGDIEPVQVLKAIHCLEYQSCEHPGWEKSEAHAFLRALEAAAMRAVPGYSATEWVAPKECYKHGVPLMSLMRDKP